MIAKVIARWKTSGSSTMRSGRQLMAYLLGPGDRADASLEGNLSSGRLGNLHVEPRIVAAWDEVFLREWQGRIGGLDWSDPDACWSVLRRLSGEVSDTATEVAADVQAELPRNAIWHTVLAAHPDDGELGPDRWQRIAARLMAETGLHPEGSQNPCRWVAVVHGKNEAGADHMHVMAVLVREDGTKPRVHNDAFAAQRACRWAEQEFGLVSGRAREPGGPSVRVRSDNASSDGEIAAVRRSGRVEAVRRKSPYARADIAALRESEGTSRMWTRQGRARTAVLQCAARAWNLDHMVALLKEEGYRVRLRYSIQDPTKVTGWSVVSTAEHAGGQPKAYSGKRLGEDCTWPRLSRHFARLEEAYGTGVVSGEEAGMLSTDRMRTVGWGEDFIAEVVRADIDLASGEGSSESAYWLRDAFWQVAWHLEGSRGEQGVWTDAAYLYAAIATVGGPPAVPEHVTAQLRQLEQWAEDAQSRIVALQRWGQGAGREASDAANRLNWSRPRLDYGDMGYPQSVGEDIIALSHHRQRLREWDAIVKSHNHMTAQLNGQLADAGREIDALSDWMKGAREARIQLLIEQRRYEKAQERWRAAMGRLLADAHGSRDLEAAGRLSMHQARADRISDVAIGSR